MTEEATDVMTPLKQECVGQEARALPASVTSGRHRKARCLQGGLSWAVHPHVLGRPCCLTLRAVVCVGHGPL